jgi:hypothetical protein
MNERDSQSAPRDECTQSAGHAWELVRADRVPHQYWPPYADLLYRCGHCGSQRHVRQSLRQ